jgi:Fic family protein
VRFDEAYDPKRLTKLARIVSVAASHHRYVWIHPFYDGNGRVVRLMSYAALKEANVGNELWSVVRLGFPIDVVERWFPLLYPVT